MPIYYEYFSPIFRKKKGDEIAHSVNTDMQSIEDFAKLSRDDRILTLMNPGDSQDVDMNYFQLLQFAILADPYKHVKFLALKSIHVFKEHPGTIQMMNEMKANNHWNESEPYFSMALSRLGLISATDFEKSKYSYLIDLTYCNDFEHKTGHNQR